MQSRRSTTDLNARTDSTDDAVDVARIELATFCKFSHDSNRGSFSPSRESTTNLVFHVPTIAHAGANFASDAPEITSTPANAKFALVLLSCA